MKKLLFVIAILGSLTASAQFNTPRFGTAPNQDATYRPLKLGQRFIADTAGTTTDTFSVQPNVYSGHIVVTVKDSVALSANIKSQFLDDELTIVFENTAGANHKVYFTGAKGVATNWQMSSSGASIALTASKRAVIKFIFDGFAWVEQFRMVQ